MSHTYKEVSDEAVKLKTNSDRYEFIRDILVQGMDPRMDGTMIFRVRTPRGRGRTFDEVIDNLIKGIDD